MAEVEFHAVRNFFSAVVNLSNRPWKKDEFNQYFWQASTGAICNCELDNHLVIMDFIMPHCEIPGFNVLEEVFQEIKPNEYQERRNMWARYTVWHDGTSKVKLATQPKGTEKVSVTYIKGGTGETNKIKTKNTALFDFTDEDKEFTWTN